MRKTTNKKHLKKRGRPFGSKNKKTILKSAKSIKLAPAIVNYDNLINSKAANILKKSMLNLADGLKKVVVSFFNTINK